MIKNSLILVITFLLLLLFTGCELEEQFEKQEQTQLITINGDSEYWNLTGYELKIEDNEMFAGDGELHHKIKREITDYVSFKMIAMIDDEKVELQGMKIVSSVSNFNNIGTGSATQRIPVIKGEGIKLTDIDNYYAVIEWISPEGERKSEKIKPF
ncbi:hypothetical protein SAMN04487944_101272 [Gracilibacillus ureilyticus]|uniref:Lipoprotein n=1 Tax=Gracilibacillus ureilyticus TaxID=531814 RepID=A0A1H9LIN2_9BACI|nr:hypothetical protein [Gracilibacillus ureilyticus]SER11264.1 hypothetical protein SAMN04487944_101272 [Gracilibacillus ureilyticus]